MDDRQGGLFDEDFLAVDAALPRLDAMTVLELREREELDFRCIYEDSFRTRHGLPSAVVIWTILPGQIELSRFGRKTNPGSRAELSNDLSPGLHSDPDTHALFLPELHVPDVVPNRRWIEKD